MRNLIGHEVFRLVVFVGAVLLCRLIFRSRLGSPRGAVSFWSVVFLWAARLVWGVWCRRRRGGRGGGGGEGLHVSPSPFDTALRNGHHFIRIGPCRRGRDHCGRSSAAQDGKLLLLLHGQLLLLLSLLLLLLLHGLLLLLQMLLLLLLL